MSENWIWHPGNLKKSEQRIWKKKKKGKWRLSSCLKGIILLWVRKRTANWLKSAYLKNSLLANLEASCLEPLQDSACRLNTLSIWIRFANKERSVLPCITISTGSVMQGTSNYTVAVSKGGNKITQCSGHSGLGPSAVEGIAGTRSETWTVSEGYGIVTHNCQCSDFEGRLELAGECPCLQEIQSTRWWWHLTTATNSQNILKKLRALYYNCNF